MTSSNCSVLSLWEFSKWSVAAGGKHIMLKLHNTDGKPSLSDIYSEIPVDSWSSGGNERFHILADKVAKITAGYFLAASLIWTVVVCCREEPQEKNRASFLRAFICGIMEKWPPLKHLPGYFSIPLCFKSSATNNLMLLRVVKSANLPLKLLCSWFKFRRADFQSLESSDYMENISRSNK